MSKFTPPRRGASADPPGPAAVGNSPEPARERPRAVARVCVAQIGGPHGVRGEVRLRSFAEEPLSLARYTPLETEDASRMLELATLRPSAKGLLIARFAGINDRDAAQELRNLKLFVPRARLPALDDETYYHADLIGLTAVGPDETPLGTVCAIQNFGAGDLLEVAPLAGGPTIMVPFTRKLVPVVDLSGGKLMVRAAGSDGIRTLAEHEDR